MQRQDAALLSIAMAVSPPCALARMSAATALRIVGKLLLLNPTVGARTELLAINPISIRLLLGPKTSNESSPIAT